MTDWNVEEAKDSIKNGGRFGAKRVMEAVYRNNIEMIMNAAVFYGDAVTNLDRIAALKEKCVDRFTYKSGSIRIGILGKMTACLPDWVSATIRSGELALKCRSEPVS